jgi:hypothetical protein
VPTTNRVGPVVAPAGMTGTTAVHNTAAPAAATARRAVRWTRPTRRVEMIWVGPLRTAPVWHG